MIIFDIGTGCRLKTKETDANNRLYCFEPVEELTFRLSNYKKENCFIIPKAVSDYNDVSKFYIAGLNNHNLSSLLNFSSSSANSWAGRDDFIITKEIKVPVIRLDTYIDSLEEKIEHIDYIHIDANGSDLNVLSGLGKYIEIIDKGDMIASIIPEAIYTHQNSLSDTIDFLRKNNFIISNVQPLDQYGNQAKVYFTKIP
jgi:FkbM family methyltransferase